jgi:hypothetical protein
MGGDVVAFSSPRNGVTISALLEKTLSIYGGNVWGTDCHVSGLLVFFAMETREREGKLHVLLLAMTKYEPMDLVIKKSLHSCLLRGSRSIDKE